MSRYAWKTNLLAFASLQPCCCGNPGTGQQLQQESDCGSTLLLFCFFSCHQGLLGCVFPPSACRSFFLLTGHSSDCPLDFQLMYLRSLLLVKTLVLGLQGFSADLGFEKLGSLVHITHHLMWCCLYEQENYCKEEASRATRGTQTCWPPSHPSHGPGKFCADVLMPYPAEEPLPGPGVVDGSAPTPEAVAHMWGCNGEISPAELVSQVGTRAALFCSSNSRPWDSVGASVASAKDSRVTGRSSSVAVSVVDTCPSPGDADCLAPGAGLTSLVVLAVP